MSVLALSRIKGAVIYRR